MVGQRETVRSALVFTTLIYIFVEEHFRTVICDTLSQRPFTLSLLVGGNARRITIHLRLHRRRSTGICCVTSFSFPDRLIRNGTKHRAIRYSTHISFASSR